MTRTLFHGGDLFDGTGEDPRPADVVVDGERIVSVGAPGTGDAEEAVDLTGRTMLPGLFDCHVHVLFSGIDILRDLQTPFSYRFFLAARNLGDDVAGGDHERAGRGRGRRRREAGGRARTGRRATDADRRSTSSARPAATATSTSPAVSTCRSWASPYPGKPSCIVDGADEMRRKVRELIRAGADVLKVASSGGVLSVGSDPRRAHFRPAELDVLVEEATAAGRPVMAHAQATDGIKNAVRAGVRSIEHGVFLDDEAIGLMLERDAWLVPTLVAPIWVLESVDAGAQITDASIRKAREVVDVHADSVRRAVAAGVKVAMGTDAGVGPHGDNLRELALMARGRHDSGGRPPRDDPRGGPAPRRRRTARHGRGRQAG